MRAKKPLKKLPLVSIVIPTYNSGRTIEKCLQSIKKQTYPNIEVIVVDSLYYDKNNQKICKKIIEKYAKYYLDGPERSIQRNRGIKEAKGEYVFMVDQDMYLSSQVIEECVAYMQKGYVALLIPEISIGEGYWTSCVALDRYVNNYLETSLNECCRFFRKKDALAVGGYDPTIVGAEDADFHNKMERLGKIAKTKEVIHHDEGKTIFWGRVKKKYYYSKAFREYVHRYPNLASKQFLPFKLNYVKHWRVLIRQPHITCGMFLLKGTEAMAGVLGIIYNK